jgi:uncharacterized Rmd1/YagE family protein
MKYIALILSITIILTLASCYNLDRPPTKPIYQISLQFQSVNDTITIINDTITIINDTITIINDTITIIVESPNYNQQGNSKSDTPIWLKIIGYIILVILILIFLIEI